MKQQLNDFVVLVAAMISAPSECLASMRQLARKRLGQVKENLH
jgi:hypothetical protein